MDEDDSCDGYKIGSVRERVGVGEGGLAVTSIAHMGKPTMCIHPCCNKDFLNVLAPFRM